MAMESGQMQQGLSTFFGGNQEVNIGEYERWGSVIGGGVLLIAALNRMSLPTLGLAAIGGCLLYRGATGHCSAVQYFKEQSQNQGQGGGERQQKQLGAGGQQRSQGGGQREKGRQEQASNHKS